jgi:dihydrolipoamide dehydrogenase
MSDWLEYTWLPFNGSIFWENEMTREVDVAIIGAGSAGLFALSQVRKYTDRYVLIDGGELGTTCARVGCMPSKVLIQVAEDFHRRKIFSREGIDGEAELSVDAEAALEHVQDLRDVFVDKTLAVTDELGPDQLVEAYARFVDNNTLEVDGEQIRAKSIVIATGSSPVVPAAWQDFSDNIITTDDLFEREDLPDSMAVIGLGVIGLEIGQSLQRLGVDVTGFDMLTSIAGLQDEVVNQQAITIIGKELPMFFGAAASIDADGEQLKVSAGENTVTVDKVFASLGRRPNLSQLGLENTDIKLDDSGIPVFDAHTMQLADMPVFIAGDVDADRPILHEAGHEGRVAGLNAVRSALGENITAFKRKTPLAITFCDPNIATIGARLDQLNADTTAIAEIAFGPVSRALMIGKNRGVLRLYVNKSDGLLLGAAMVCVKGENIAHLIAWSIQQRLTVFDMLKMPFYHPVIEEALQAALYSVLAELDVKQELVELEEV